MNEDQKSQTSQTEQTTQTVQTEQTGQMSVASAPAQQATKPFIPPVETKGDTKLLTYIVIALGALVVLAVIGIIVGINLLLNSRIKPVTPPPVKEEITPTPTPQANYKYASEAAVIKLKNDLKKLNAQIGSTDYFETEILPPSLDSEIKIE